MRNPHPHSTITLAILAFVLWFTTLVHLNAQPRLTPPQAAALTPTPPDLVPKTGTFWSLSRPNNPPTPCNPFPTLTCYQLPDGSWLVDDTSVDFDLLARHANPVMAARDFLTQQYQAAARTMLATTDTIEVPGPTNPPPVDPPPQLLAAGTAPQFGTFWFQTRSNYPPLPFNPCADCEVWALSNGNFLVDDTFFIWPTPTGEDPGATYTPLAYPYTNGEFYIELVNLSGGIANVILHNTTPGTLYTITSKQTLSPAEPWNAETEVTGAAGTDTPAQVRTFGRSRLFFQAHAGLDAPHHLWLQAIAATNGYLYCFLIGTTEGSTYEILSKTSLNPTEPWASEGLIPAATNQFWTPFAIPMSSHPSLFIRARNAFQDSLGTGIPDWWWLDNFGADWRNLGDPYADPDGDGWSNLQEYQNGTCPTNFNTPAAPLVSVNPVPSYNGVLVTWQACPGPVMTYTIMRWGQVITNVPATQLSYEDDTINVPPSSSTDGFATYQVRANYPGGSSDWSQQQSPIDPSLAVPTALVRGPQGRLYLVAPNIPAGVTSLVVFVQSAAVQYPSTIFNIYSYWQPQQWFTPNVPPSYANTVAVSSFSNGRIRISNSFLPPYGNYTVACRPLTANGKLGPVTTSAQFGLLGPIYTPFLDGSEHLRQNLAFWLEAADENGPFRFTIDNNTYPPSPTYAFPQDYAYANFHFTLGFASPYDKLAYIDEFKPFQDNYYLRNFIYAPTNLNADGSLTSGVFYAPGATPPIRMPEQQPPFSFPEYAYVTQGTTTPIATMLAATNSQWIYSPYQTSPFSDWADIGIRFDAQWNLTIGSEQRNIFGLQYQTAIMAYSDRQNNQHTDLIETGGSIPAVSYQTFFYSQVAPPQLVTTGYFFGEPFRDYLPGHSQFNPAAPLQPLIVSVGDTILVAGWAKQTVNGDTNKLAYLEQYFDTAYLADANGDPTTNQTGILSPYGEFYGTEPGVALLNTASDPTTGQHGTVPVNVIKLQLDVNHDGIMDLSFTGLDNTTEARPMVWWLNNDRDEPGSGSSLDTDAPVFPGGTNDYCYGQIRTLRNLEDFARLWICGIPTLPATQGYSVQLGWTRIDSGAPRLRLYWGSEPNGGIGYLTNTIVASQQLLDYNLPIGEITPTNFLIFPLGSFTNGLPRYLLFEAGAPGKGALSLRVCQGTNTIAQTSAWLDFHDVRDLYEQALVTNVLQTWPEMVQTNLDSAFRVLSYPTVKTGDSNQLAVFVHGWRLTESDWYSFSETMFKRLYWQGFQGRFASLRWPTRSAETDANGEDILTFNRSEHISFESGTGAALYLYDLRNRFTNDTISVCSHSQGGIVMMEALKELAASGVAPLDNYVLMQAAVPAHCYDPAVLDLPALTNMEASIPTPNTYSNYASGMRAALRGGNINNLFNPADFALVSGLNGVGFGSWESNEELLKPLLFFGYIYIATNNTAYVISNQYTAAFGITNLQNRIVTDPLELMPFVARPRSKAVGAQSGVGQVMNGAEYDLQSQLGFTAKDYDHSGQFNRDIQTPQVQGFYSRLLSSLFPPQP